MRLKIPGTKLYIGDMRDCAAAGADWTVIHACKHPCHVAKCGNQGPQQPTYLHFEEGSHQWLNIVDAPSPDLFPKAIFEHFLKFANSQWGDKPMLIHCNQGHSRAPSLALLFLAKVLYKIRNTSFDDAWMDFEKLAGEEYRPGEGIETYLREHWRELDVDPYVEPSAKLTGRHSPDLEAIKAALPKDVAGAMEFIRQQPLFHFSMTKILLADHTWGAPKANLLQREMARVYQWCIQNEQKCRMIVLKPRKVGCSTFSAELCYHHMRRFPSNMLLLGDVSKRVESVFQMFSAIHERDDFGWDSTYENNTLRGKFHHKDGRVGLVQHDTALDPKVGIGETRTVVWMTEAARYSKTGVKTDKQVISALLNSIPDIPLQLVIAESTAEGAVGWFYETWQNACSLNEVMAGPPARWNGWICVFESWFAFPEHRLERNPRSEIWFQREMDERERRGVALYGWTIEQMAWRRRKISEDTAGDEKKFDEDYPEDPESAFLTSGRPRFNMDGVTRLLKIAQERHDKAEKGYLVRHDDKIQFVAAGGGDAMIWVDERPKIGLEYIAFLDPCTGIQSSGAKDPDAHAPGILRKGYHDKHKVWHDPKLVACIDVPGSCRWEDDQLAEVMVMMLDWYGACPIEIETGNGLGAIGEFQKRGAQICKRRKFNTMNPGQTIEVPGWETNSDTRPNLINALGEAIREHRFECNYLPAVQQMRTFVINDRKAEAARGAHDDWVMGIGIGLYNLDLAQMMRPAAHYQDAMKRAMMMPGGISAAAFS